MRDKLFVSVSVLVKSGHLVKTSQHHWQSYLKPQKGDLWLKRSDRKEINLKKNYSYRVETEHNGRIMHWAIQVLWAILKII